MRILVVEDDKKVAGFLQKGLQEEHYAVDVCKNGDDAIYYSLTNEYDVIILDLMLPGCDGIKVCQEIRKKKVNTPIIMLTARDTIDDKINGLSQGADDYLTKPFSFEELLARIRALMRRSQEYKTDFLQVGHLKLDPYKRSVHLKDKMIELTGKEYSLLEYLMRNKGRVLSPTKIIEHIWDMEAIGDRNLLNVYINHLRGKIDRILGKNIIHTIRGYGYKIDEDHEV